MNKTCYLVPDYFPDFHCKMGSCRHSCCEGWPVSLDRDTYFRLLGADCPPEIRRKLDSALVMNDYPTPERYARLHHRYDGNCALRNEDGRCALQMILGEGAIPDVCRLYPRGIRKDTEGKECSCSNSCEAVPELFWNRKEPLSFVSLPLELKEPALLPLLPAFSSVGREREMRLLFIFILQDRSLPLQERFPYLQAALRCAHRRITEEDREAEQELWNGSFRQNVAPLPRPKEEQLLRGLNLMKQIVRLTEAHSDSLHPYAKMILERFEACEAPLALYERLDRDFALLNPNHEAFLEHLLVNHLFFSRFPFQDRPQSLPEEYAVLCVIYAMLRFLCLGSCLQAPCREQVIDVCAGAFRMIAHTDFEHYVFRLVRKLSLTQGELDILISL